MVIDALQLLKWAFEPFGDHGFPFENDFFR